MKKKLILLIVLLCSICSCGGGSSSKSNGKYTIGILQDSDHTALSLARFGFVEILTIVLTRENYELDFIYKNSYGNSSKLDKYAGEIIPKCDITIGIGTVAAQKLKSKRNELGIDKPILFTAVTDPVGAGLVNSLEAPGDNISGYSDVVDIGKQIEIVPTMNPDAKKLGIFYTNGDASSKKQVDEAEIIAANLGLDVTTVTCNNKDDLLGKIQGLSEIVDAIYIPTDNNVSANTNLFKGKCGSTMLLAGTATLLEACHYSYTIDYRALGELTSMYAARTLFGKEDLGTIPVGIMPDEYCVYIYSSSNCEASGFDITSEKLSGYINYDTLTK